MSPFSVQPVEKLTPEQIREARVTVARRCSSWTEAADDFVPRGRGLLVSAETDHVYTPARGVIFQTGSATIVADQAPYHFVVDDDGGLRFFERQSRTWTEQLEGRARARAARSASRRFRRSGV